jgi:hypothetical protein
MRALLKEATARETLPRRVGEFHAAGVLACFIGIACAATIDILTA